MPSTAAEPGSAKRWGPLWGARPGDWARSEEQQLPTYEEAIARVGVAPGQLVLDVGCGVGVFLALAAERGAKPHGVDASESLVALARSRVPGADVRVGDMERLPYADDTFDLVTGFNSFFFAADIVAALREAGRVARPGAPVVIQVWGRPERCALEAMKRVARPFMPKRPASAPPQPELWRPGVLEALATEAGLTPQSAFETSWAFEFPDDEALGSAMMAPMGLAEVVGRDREPAVRAEIVAALASCRRPGGGYRIENEYRYLIAR
jgi:SAM-dependent methyltransferase